jgi:cyclic pyranopterin phosphate synthase
MKDKAGREIDYLRISITDRCNLRCKYCMPGDIETTDMENLLTYEEIVQVTEAAAALGIRHIRGAVSTPRLCGSGRKNKKCFRH